MKRTTFLALSLGVSLAFIAFASEVIEKKPLSMPPEPGAFGTVPDEKQPELSGTVTVTSAEGSRVISGQTLIQTNPDKSVLVAEKNTSVAVSKSTLNKKGGKTSSEGQSNFYGLNAAVAAQEGATLSLKNTEITSSAEGANAVFSTGKGALITVKDVKIHTTKDSSRGLDATYGGEIRAEKVSVTTEGAHCAAFATDRGEGIITVNGGTAQTKGEGSPVIYSTGTITVKNLTGKASGSEIACIEGKNSIILEKVNLTGGTQQGSGGDTASGIMLYQSMSGDANRGTASLTATASTLTSHASGPFFYVTNTDARISLSKTKLVNAASSVLLQVSGNNSHRHWGKAGSNGGNLTFTSSNQSLEGNVIVDGISTISLDFASGTVFSGAINASNQGTVNLKLSPKAKLTLTADSFVNVLDAGDADFKNIKSNGHTLFYNKNALENVGLKGRTYLLSDGGKVCATDKITLSSESSQSKDGAAFSQGPKDGSFSSSPKKASDMMGKKIDMGSLSTYKGKILESGENMVLQAEDGKNYILCVQEFPEKSGGPAKGMGKGPMGKPGTSFPDAQDSSLMPPVPPQGALPPQGGMTGGAPSGQIHAGQPPKPVSMNDLKKLKGKTVEIKGFLTTEGKLTVLTAEKV